MKKITVLLVGLILAISGAIILHVLNRPSLEIEAHSAALMDASTGHLLFGQSEHEPCSPGSLTKLMVIYLIYDRVEEGKLNWSELVRVSEGAAGVDGSKVGLRENEFLDVKSLLYCIALPSGGDAAIAVGEHIAGNETNFVKLMNETATELGMKDTHYTNVPGFDNKEHSSTAYDTALLAQRLLESFPDIQSISSQMEATIIRQVDGKTINTLLKNTNTLIPLYRGCNGLKTGSTTDAGYCLCATAQRDEVKLIAVVMGATSIEGRQNEAVKLLDYGFGRMQAD